MADLSKVPGLHRLRKRTDGDPRVCIAVLDGPVDVGHPCFRGANLRVLPVLGDGEAVVGGPMSAHGTHVASMIFGQKESPVEGLAPNCQGVIVPIFSDSRPKVSQLDLTRGIEIAVEAGAHLINISGGQLVEDAEGEVDEWLSGVVELCRERNVLIIAAAGNDRCACRHLPAALPSVLAVGAMDDDGYPMDFSNWGYGLHGLLAPGFDVLGAIPGGETARLTGSSFAAPVVTGVAALLLSEQLVGGEAPSTRKIHEALLAGVQPCKFRSGQEPARCLAGRLNVTQTLTSLLKRNYMSSKPNPEVVAAACTCEDTTPAGHSDFNELTDTESGPESFGSMQMRAHGDDPAFSARSRRSGGTAAGQGLNFGVVPAGQPQPQQFIAPSSDFGLVYALGTLGYDFGTEARRDTFKQLMPPVEYGNTRVPSNPYDARQMVDYLEKIPSESKSLIWTLNLELTPIYAIEPVGSYGNNVYDVLRTLLAGEIEPENSEKYVDRVSVPGRLSGRTARLFSGQVVPVIELDNVRGLFGWQTNKLITAAVDAVKAETENVADDARVRRTVEGFLNRVYYDMRNLGTTSRDRALNFAVTNAFQAYVVFADAVGEGKELDSIVVEKSPICRLDSDCWDVKLKFFDPENNRMAKVIYRFTIDVSDSIPVTLGEIRQWREAY